MNDHRSIDDSDYAFTVFIPTFNRAHTLDRALESAAAQTHRDFEVLIIDDGSEDDTR
ncbi:MAG: glycosyltransferase family A protein, partial [Desulfobacterales bacterium]